MGTEDQDEPGEEGALLEREEVVAAYRELARARAPAGAAWLSLLEDLPPFLCQRLSLGEDVSFVEAEASRAYTGAVARFDGWRPARAGFRDVLILRDGDIGSLVGWLPLGGHRPASDRGPLVERTRQALEQMDERRTGPLRTVTQWTSLVVWLEGEEGADEQTLTSSTFPLLPHCTFVTEKALRHIPPNSVADEPVTYALRENLYHEALHQELAATLLHREVLTPDYWADTAERVPVPWQRGGWEPDRAFHALVVYAGVTEMRRRELGRTPDAETGEWLEGAYREGLKALEHLVDRLDDRIDIFTARGRELYETVRSHASRVSAAA